MPFLWTVRYKNDGQHLVGKPLDTDSKTPFKV